jgi:hypothetical protein
LVRFSGRRFAVEHIGRRRAVASVGVAGAALVVPVGTARAEQQDRPSSAPAAPLPEPAAEPGVTVEVDAQTAHDLAPAGEAERALLGPLADGAPFAAGGARFRIASLYAARGGAIPLVVEGVDRPVRFAVEIFRRDERDGSSARAPVATTATLALAIANRGDGERATHEAQGLATMAIARAIGEREARVPLLTQRERAQRHPHGVFHVPL